MSAFFYCLAGLCLFPGAAAAGVSADNHCLPDEPDSRVTVAHVIDGDTVVLGDDEHLRLIGIDTPEIDHDGNDTQAGALAARDFLRQLLARDEAHPLVFDRERRDRHGRLLGHLFLPGGGNIQARLLRRGYAVPLTIPPNLRFLDCYRAAAEAARERHRGLWRRPQYRPVAASRLESTARGYRIVSGRVTRIGSSRTSRWINLGEGFALRILRKDLEWFAEPKFQGLVGKNIEARGRVYRRNDQLRMRLRHPVDLRVLPNGTGNR